MKKWVVGLLSPLLGWSLECQPWFGDLYEFDLLATYAYSQFSSVQGARPPYHHFFQSNLLSLGLDFCPNPDWSVDADFQCASTTSNSFYWQSVALQGRYLWLDDVIGDPISLTTGLSCRATSTTGLKDISCPSHGNADIELNFALGREFDSSRDWRFRCWAFGALGQANRGSPWVRGIVALESNVRDTHRFAFFVLGTNGYGRHTHVHVNQFFGYGKIREKVIDVGLRYGLHFNSWGTLRLSYARRVLAKAAPENVNTWAISFLFPFSL